MSIFSKIKNAIFGHKEEAPAPAAEAPAIPMTTPEAAPAAPAAMAEVDVEASLNAMTGAADLNWQSSIVDLMKLLGIDASFENRKSLAHELGDADYSGSAEENIALHKAVMNALAANGGRVPASMLD
ncbi:DUF3597 domain-containing protein [Novosphingobium sp. B 225]|uniref:DUF3597 domain-containing protein n=1 Tax=Novosphingobium sp. B 225 TaxID=1961849 RepID=UPI000B4AFCBF|nr:DUF3597 domain-containing protein [Novosphingobium sp. B 225]